VHVATGLSAAQIKAYRLADNQTASLSHWNEDLLPLELAALQEMRVDLNLTGFSAQDLLRLLAPPATTGFVDPDATPSHPMKRRPAPVISGTWAATASCVATVPNPKMWTTCLAAPRFT
jgi:hypothetical protein